MKSLMSHNKQITLIMNTNNVTNISDDFVYFQCICDTSVLWLVWTVTKTVSFRQQHSFPFFIRNQFHFNNSTHMTSNIAQPYHTTLRTAHIDVNKEEGKRNSCDQKGHCKWATERHEQRDMKRRFLLKNLQWLRGGNLCVVAKRIWFQWLACKQIILE